MTGFAAMSPRRKRLVAGTTVAFAACALLPGTGPSLRHNLSGAAQSVVNWFHEDDGEYGDIKDTANPSPAVFRARLPLDQAVAAQMSSDFAVQLAACERSIPPNAPGYNNYDSSGESLPPANVLNGSAIGRNEQIAHKLYDTLAPRFGGNPAFHAAVLRNLAYDAVRLNNRRDADVFNPSPAPKNSWAAMHPLSPPPPPTPENLRLWHDAAQAGERLEPQNAYFPLMEAVGFFAENRDGEGKAALLRASAKPAFEGHDGDASVGLLRLEEAEGREPTAIFRLWVQLSRTLPDYAALQNLKYIAAAKAMEAELQNRTDDGFHIRQALRRVGATLRENSQAWSGTWLGQGFVQAACLRPGGEAPLNYQTTDREAKVSAGYETYLRRTGHADEAEAVAFEERERIANGALFRSVQNNPAYFMNLPRLLRLLLLPTAGLVLLCGALGVLMAGAIAALLARTRRIMHGLPLPGAVQAGVVSAVLLPIGLGIALSAGSEMGTVVVAVGMSAACGVGIMFRNRCRKATAIATAGRHSAKPLHASLLWAGGFAGTWALVGAWGFLAFWGGRVALSPVSDLQDLSPSECFFGFCCLSACMTPVLLALLAVCSRKIGVPASVGMVRGLRGLAVPVACIMVLLAVPLWIGSAMENATLNRDLNRIFVSESRYIAEIENKPWPLHARP